METVKDDAFGAAGCSTEFFLFIPPLSRDSGVITLDYQLQVVRQIATCFSNGTVYASGNSVSPIGGASLIAKACCTGQTYPTAHQKHFVRIQISSKYLQQAALLLRPDLQQNEQVLVEAISQLTPGQAAWLSELSIRTCHIRDEDFHELLRITKSAVSDESNPTKANLFTLQRLGLVSELVLCHNHSQRRAVWSKNFSTFRLFPDCEALRSYFGDSVGFYFTWMRTYILFLLELAVFSVIFSLISELIILIGGAPSSLIDQVMSSPSLLTMRSLYTIFVVVSALVCTKLWSRQYAMLVEQWSGNSLLERTANDLAWLFTALDQRPEFHGTPRRSRITGEMEVHFAARKRRWRYMFSGSIIFLCLAIAGLVNVFLLNLEGFIIEQQSPWLYFRFVSRYSSVGALFDPNRPGFCAYLPGILHSLLVFVMNQVLFRRIAEHLTAFENHQGTEDYDRSLVFKRFLFESVDAYGCLAYLGFVLSDRTALKSLLMTMLLTDSVRRITLECALPWLVYRFRVWQERLRSGEAKRNEETKTEVHDTAPLGASLDREICADTYDPFDDYLEMALQHGYLVLFAFVCPPLSAVIALLSTILEAHTDAFKMLMVTRRPSSHLLLRGKFIWLNLLAAQSWLSILTNVGLFNSALEMSSMDLGVHSSTLFLLLEHTFVGIGLAIHFFIEDTPVSVRDARRSRDLKRSGLFSSSSRLKVE